MLTKFLNLRYEKENLLSQIQLTDDNPVCVDTDSFLVKSVTADCVPRHSPSDLVGISLSVPHVTNYSCATKRQEADILQDLIY